MSEMSLGAFIGHLAGFRMRLDEAMHEGLDRAARVVQEEAKRELGTYQDQAGPFAAWAELADSTKTDRVKAGYAENEPGLRSGEMRDSIGHAVGHDEAVVGSDAEEMAWFELGTSRQPPRSVLGTAAVRKGEAVAHILGRSAVKALVGRGVFGGELLIPD
jgi:phage gpG-like protein